MLVFVLVGRDSWPLAIVTDTQPFVSRVVPFSLALCPTPECLFPSTYASQLRGAASSVGIRRLRSDHDCDDPALTLRLTNLSPSDLSPEAKWSTAQLATVNLPAFAPFSSPPVPRPFLPFVTKHPSTVPIPALTSGTAQRFERWSRV